MSMFKKAERSAVFLKLALAGSAGSGKTMSALRLARGLVGPTGKIAVIDTENGSASLYADLTDFDVCNVENKDDWQSYADMILDAERAGYSCIIIDSFSHAWEAILEYKDKLDQQPRGNSYTNWKDAGRKFKNILRAITDSKMHVFCCLRTKTEYVLEANDRGKQVPRKIGTAPIMREGIEFEFTTVFDIAVETHTATCSKDRTGLFAGQDFQITEDTGRQLEKWRELGKPLNPNENLSIAERAARMLEMFEKHGVTRAMIEARLGHPIANIMLEEFDELTFTYKELKEGRTSIKDWSREVRQSHSRNLASAIAEAKPVEQPTPQANPPTTDDGDCF